MLGSDAVGYFRPHADLIHLWKRLFVHLDRTKCRLGLAVESDQCWLR